MQLDVFAEDSSDELTETERNSIKMAMAIIGGTCISLHSSKVYSFPNLLNSFLYVGMAELTRILILQIEKYGRKFIALSSSN